jgi:hypothetical protein
VPDPFARLGLGRDATADDVLAARRRLAKELHPDVGGDPERMREVNVAVQEALRAIGATAPVTAPPPQPAAARPAPPRGTVRSGWRAAHDSPSFTIEALPAEAFEALVIVTAWMGEVLVDDPPYLLEAHLYDPFDCWCRVELIPDAGASSVGLVVAVEADRRDALPDVDAVRDEYVANLNRLDWTDLDREQARPASNPPPP